MSQPAGRRDSKAAGEVPWQQLAALHLESLGWARSCCRQDAEEAENVLQAVYLKIVEGRALFDGRSTLRTWLFAVIPLPSATPSPAVALFRFAGDARLRLTSTVLQGGLP
jgi:Sigma-70 region 2